MIIGFIGIDGSGKTTQAQRLYTALHDGGYNCAYLHFDSIFAHRLLNINARNQEKVVDRYKVEKLPKSLRVKQGIISKVKFLWSYILILDDLLFYLIKFNHSSAILICDRYFYDTVVSCIYFGASKSLMFRLIDVLYPKPHVIFLLDIDPFVAHTRKNEDSIKYLIDKRRLYLDLQSQKSEVIKKIDSGCPIEVVSQQICCDVKHWLE